MGNEMDSKWLNKIAYLEDKKRQDMFEPERILEEFNLSKDSVALDFGAGTGFFTLPLARLACQKVIALDMDQRMLDFIKHKAINEDLNNILYDSRVLSESSYPDESLDLVIASLIFHELKQLSQAIAILSKTLKSGGTLYCVEYEKADHIQQGPPMEIRVSSSELSQLLQAHGFSIEKVTKLSEAIYSVVATKL